MRRPFLAGLVVGLAACGGSGYRPSEVPVPQSFRETKGDTTAQAVPVPPPPPPPAPADSTRVPEAGPSERHADVTVDQTSFWRALTDTTLDRLMTEMLGANLDVRSAAARVRGARAARTEASLDLAPTVTAGGSYTRQRISGAQFPIGTGQLPDQDIWDAGFDATWELDLFGRIRRNVQGQTALVSAASEDLRDVQVSLAAELARTYFELRGAQERLDVAGKNAENQRRSLEVTQQRLDAGRGTAFDTERARAQLGTTLATIPDLEAQVASAQYQIGVLVGRSPAQLAQELTTYTAIPVLPANVAIESPDSLIRQRPDVSAAERQVAAERAFVSAAKADYLPRITVGGSVGTSSTEFSGLGDDGTLRYNVGPVVSWPFLDLGRVKARVDQNKALAAEAEAQYSQTVLRALQDVETSLSRYRTSRVRVDRLADAAAASARAANLARLRFEGGVADFLQVLDAERTQLEAEDQLAQAHTDAATSYAALYKALGGSRPMEASGTR